MTDIIHFDEHYLKRYYVLNYSPKFPTELVKLTICVFGENAHTVMDGD